MDDNYNLQVGQRLFSARKLLKMTRAELGKKLNLHESTIKRYEDGEIKSLDIDKIKEFARALETTPAYLLGWDSCDTVVNRNQLSFYATPHEVCVFTAYHNQPEMQPAVDRILAVEKAEKPTRPRFVLNAAHAIEGASEEDKQHDEDIMNDPDF